MAVDVIRIDLSEPRLPRSASRVGRVVEVARTRLILAAMVFVLAFAGVGVRLADLMVLGRDGTVVALTRGAGGGAAIGPGDRADIVDRNGVMLATTLPTVSLYADPMLILDPIEAALKLTETLPELDTDTLITEFSSEKRFVWIRRGLTPRQQYDVNKLGIPGLAFLEEQRRYYPAGDLTAHILGFTDIDGNGIAGVEQSMNGQLADGGEPLALSIDIRVQAMVRDQLAASIAEFRAIGGAAAVMDARTGEMVAMVSLPDFSPYDRSGIDPDALFNRMTLGVYEMGSTFKIFNTAMALESGTSTLTSIYDARNPIRIGRFSITDFHPEGRALSVVEIFTRSSNIGSVHMMQAAGVERQREFLERLGLTRAPSLELPEIGAPLIPNPWREINAMTIAFGHGMAVSPVQLVGAVGAVVNGGVFHPPTLLRLEEMPVGERVMAPEISDALRRLMRSVVTDGTASFADADGYVVGGKTGTAEKTSGRGYSRNARLSSFVGAFPMHDPRYVVFAMLDEPQPTAQTYGYATGGWTAAPLAGRIVAALGPMVGVTPVDDRDPVVLAATSINALLPGGLQQAVLRND